MEQFSLKYLNRRADVKILNNTLLEIILLF